ncbi:MAG: hypothetical protein E7329_02120 [Clostridiales bacterium]|nr:hypothetical protein [Clostridiales bacterium]
MKPKAIVYTSNTGFTARYAKMIGEKAKLPVYEMAEAESKLAQGSEILYMGWLMASTVKDYRKAAKRYAIAGVCGVGLCDTGALLKEVRKINKIPKDAAVFTLQGGMNHEKLEGTYKSMIQVLQKVLSLKKNPDEGTARMIRLIHEGGDYVAEENIAAVMEWLNP